MKEFKHHIKEDFIKRWHEDFKLLYDDGRMAIVSANYTNGFCDGDDVGNDIGLYWSNTNYEDSPYPTIYGKIKPLRLNNKFAFIVLQQIVNDDYCINKERIKKLITLYAKRLEKEQNKNN